MGDQWELDADDQMGDTVCICGKVCPNSGLHCKTSRIPPVIALEFQSKITVYNMSKSKI